MKFLKIIFRITFALHVLIYYSLKTLFRKISSAFPEQGFAWNNIYATNAAEEYCSRGNKIKRIQKGKRKSAVEVLQDLIR